MVGTGGSNPPGLKVAHGSGFYGAPKLEMTTMTIRVLKSNESFSPQVKITGKKAQVQWSVKKDKSEKSPRFAIATELDFSAVSAEELMTLAIRPVVIELQRQWRELAATKGSTATTVNPFKTVNVKTAIVDATRKTADPVARAKAAMSKLSDKERAAILAAFQASVQAGKKSA